jgi:hypothetical integral membrane protein (TIGR02206 family)
VPEFSVFDRTHLLALGLTALGIVLSFVLRKPLSAPGPNRTVRLGLAAALLLNEVLFQVFEVSTGHWSLGFSLRIHYCQIATFLLAFTLLTLSERTFQISYFWLMTGMLHGLFTPNLKPEDPPHVVVDFFVYHGLTLVGLAFLLATTRLRPTWKGLWFTVGVSILLMPVIGLVNWILDVNYWFLCEKPYGDNLTSVMPAWPWYVLWFVPVGILHYLVVYAPFALARRWVSSAST